MLYSGRSQINVPRDRRLGNSSHLNVAVSCARPPASVEGFGSANLRRGILRTLETAKVALDPRMDAISAVGVQKISKLLTAW